MQSQRYITDYHYKQGIKSQTSKYPQIIIQIMLLFYLLIQKLLQFSFSTDSCCCTLLNSSCCYCVFPLFSFFVCACTLTHSLFFFLPFLTLLPLLYIVIGEYQGAITIQLPILLVGISIHLFHLPIN